VTAGIAEVEAAINQQSEDAQVEARAKLMLSSCLLESKLFVMELFTFMRRFHERYSPALPPKEVWSILQYLSRVVISDLRRPASGVKWGDTHRSPTNGGKLLWATYQVIKASRVYVVDYAAGWEGHPMLSPDNFDRSRVVTPKLCTLNSILPLRRASTGSYARSPLKQPHAINPFKAI
jgi:hypothetical protein